jgi:hypothetical protein
VGGRGGGGVQQPERSKTGRGREARKLKCSFLVMAYSMLFRYIGIEDLKLLLIILL